MPFFGGIVVRLSDRLVLSEVSTASSSSSTSSSSSSTTSLPVTLWPEVIAKLAKKLRSTSFLDFSNTGSGGGSTRYAVHILSDEDIAFAVVSDEHLPRRTAHQCLDELAKLYQRMFVENPASLTPSMTSVFKQPFQEHLEKSSQDGAFADERVKKVKQTVQEVKELALDNVERVLQRGEKIDDIVNATEDLQSQASGFHRNARALRSQMWWNGMKGKLIIGGAIGMFLLVVYLIFCGGISCTSSSSSS